MNNFKLQESVDLTLKNNVQLFLRVSDERALFTVDGTHATRPHAHRHAEMILVTRGRAICRFNTAENEIKRGDLLIIDSSVQHSIINPESFTCVVLGIDGITFYTDETNYILPLKESYDSFEFLFTGIYNETQKKHRGYRDVILGFLQTITIWLTRKNVQNKYDVISLKSKTKYNDGIYVAKNFIDTYYSRDINLDQLCELAYVSPQHLIRQFKQLTGHSPKQYLNRVRVQIASERILHSAENIKIIAKDVGYTDYQTFLYTFKLLVGISPQQFREDYKSTPSKGKKLTTFFSKDMSPKISHKRSR